MPPRRRAPASSKEAAPRAARGPRGATAPATGGTAGAVEAVLATLREEVAGLRAEVAGLRLRESVELMARSAAELPRAEDFQPLADHLYAFAQSAPRLLESLEAVRAAVGPLEAAARSLGEVAETLVATQQGWTESLLRLPRAEDYEPLTGPLREFARVSPVLAETLASVVKAVTPLPGLVDRLAASRAESAAPAAGRAGGSDGLRTTIEQAADRMAAARAAIREGLATLPREPAYGKAAAQLRELATVSPSLMEWMRQLPAMTLPLGDALSSLERAAHDLEKAEQAARRALDD